MLQGLTAQGHTGAIWLNSELLSPYDYWQFWRNTDDRDVVRFLKLFTDLSLERIEELGQLEGAAVNEAKKVLADEATRRVLALLTYVSRSLPCMSSLSHPRPFLPPLSSCLTPACVYVVTA